MTIRLSMIRARTDGNGSLLVVDDLNLVRRVRISSLLGRLLDLWGLVVLEWSDFGLEAVAVASSLVVGSGRHLEIFGSGEHVCLR